MKLVRSGIYAYCRNPSVHGKLLGVLSVGFALNSFSFCFVLVPVLLVLWNGEAVILALGQEPAPAADGGRFLRGYMWAIPPWMAPSRSFIASFPPRVSTWSMTIPTSAPAPSSRPPT